MVQRAEAFSQNPTLLRSIPRDPALENRTYLTLALTLMSSERAKYGAAISEGLIIYNYISPWSICRNHLHTPTLTPAPTPTPNHRPNLNPSPKPNVTLHTLNVSMHSCLHNIRSPSSTRHSPSAAPLAPAVPCAPSPRAQLSSPLGGAASLTLSLFLQPPLLLT